MNNVQLKQEDYANYSRLLNIQFIEFARSEIISNEEAHALFLTRFIKDIIHQLEEMK